MYFGANFISSFYKLKKLNTVNARPVQNSFEFTLLCENYEKILRDEIAQ